MRKGDKVRWAEAHCRLESWKAKPHQAVAVYDDLRSLRGALVDKHRIGQREVLDFIWDGGWEVHTVPAELLERALP